MAIGSRFVTYCHTFNALLLMFCRVGKIFACMFLLCNVAEGIAAPIKTICGEYTYVVPENVTREEAKRIATERARIDALAKEFGTSVSEVNNSLISNRNEESNVLFQSLGSSDVRGEWLGDTNEPSYSYSIDSKTGMSSVTVHVCGKAREIKRSEVPLEIKVLRNGTEPKYESESFRAGDDLYVSFLSPIEGYLAVFLMDGNGQVVCMLPYQSQTMGAYKVDANRSYILFSKDMVAEMNRAMVDEYVMTCAGEQETNYLYFIFSMQPFSKPAMSEGVISFEKFNEWRERIMRQDKQAQQQIKTIQIQQ